MIEKITYPTDWCAPMVPVMKPNGKVRICIDLKKKNENIKRERYMLTHDRLNPCQTRGVQHILVTGGFWQIPLHSESSLLTTFITVFARYCFKRLPFGISIAPEIFQRKMNELLGDFDEVAVYMDDLVHRKVKKSTMSV